MTESAVTRLFEICSGDMRKVVNMLQSISISIQGSLELNEEIDDAYICKLTGSVSYNDMMYITKILMEDNIKNAIQKI
jgi:replication factor C subunit 3/5